MSFFISSNAVKLPQILQNFTEVEGILYYKNQRVIEVLDFLPINASQLSFGDWGGSSPSFLFKIIDGDNTTFCDWAGGYGSGNRGWIKADLLNLQTGEFEIKSEIALNVGWGENKIKYFVETSSDNNMWTLRFEKLIDMNAGEINIYSSSFTGRYIRWGLFDVGQGAGKMRTAYLKVKI